jgi:hypothetical protein
MQPFPDRNPSTGDPLPDKPLFPLGRLVATRGAIALLNELQLSPYYFVNRHRRGDWGDLCPEDIEANKRALLVGARLLSAYRIDASRKLWIITEADRSSTCLLLPEEY